MRKLVIVAGAFALAACASEAEAPVEEEEAVEEMAEATSTVEMGGTYSRTNDDGVEVSTTLNDDGTYTAYENGEEVGGGTWTADAENGTCFVQTSGEMEEGDGEPRCFITGEVQADGTMEVTNPEGDTYTVNKVE